MNTNEEKLNDNVDEMSQNGFLYRKTEKSYKLISILYVVLFGLYTFMLLVYGITLEGEDAVTALIEALFLKPAIILCGVMACRKKNMIFAISSAVIQLLSLIFKFNTLNVLLLIAVIALVIKINLNNHTYKYLSEQMGFPHFNERRTNQDFDKKQREIKDEFQQSYERRMKTATDEMGDLSKATPNNFMSEQYEKTESEMDEI